jgi:hypothetical protein
MNKNLLLIIFLISMNNIFSLTKEDIENMINKKKQKEEEDDSKFKPPNIAIFTLYPNKIKDLHHFSRILQEFLSTIGISANIVNIRDNEIIATFQRGKFFDKKIILNNFKDVIEKVDIADFTKNQ